jgi:alpha-glucosidase
LAQEAFVVDSHWWQEAVFYQIYPRSFADGNGDGIGDFAGIIEHLDYLRDLGIDAIWLSPHYPSPQMDCGYDISDYTGVAPEYGTLETFHAFLEGAHQRHMRVILDLVLNHTSDQHPWFQASRSGRDHPQRDWYIWRDGRSGPDGERLPPNNWESNFTGSAWEYDAATDQYYYHHFLKEQPDLNWRNPAVRAAMWDVVRFWLGQGVDGFRLDAIATIFEHPDLPDHTSDVTLLELYAAWASAHDPELEAELSRKWERLFEYQVNLPEVHDLMKELRQVVNGYGDVVLVGEDEKIAYYGNGDDELHMVFNFALMRTRRLTPAQIRANQAERLAQLPPGAWPCNTLGNHDSPRVKSAFGDGEHDAELARLSLALLLTLRGTPFLYYGEEIGMVNGVLDQLEQFCDTLALRQYALAVANGFSEDQAFALIREWTRDVARTPMQWDNAPNAGFSPAGVATWLPVHPNYAGGVNVADQLGDAASMLAFYRRLLGVRRSSPALRRGEYTSVLEENASCLAFLRRIPDQVCLVVLNYTGDLQTLMLDLPYRVTQMLFSSTALSDPVDLAALTVMPYGILIAEVAMA